jgi:hypothetical protein
LNKTGLSNSMRILQYLLHFFLYEEFIHNRKRRNMDGKIGVKRFLKRAFLEKNGED